MKKKGLIVATIVMVLVLAVSLTTATYAWFSTTASATVDDLAIKTQAADGLQIAMTNEQKSINDIHSGELTYDAGTKKWTGAQTTWGSFLGFTDAQATSGTYTDAVTKFAGATGEPGDPGLASQTGTFKKATSQTVGYVYYKFNQEIEGKPEVVPTAAANTVYYTYDNDTQKYTVVEGALVADTDYYTATEVAYAAGVYEAEYTYATAAGIYIPTGYTSAIEPTGYKEATPNKHYYAFDMAITNTSAIYKLGMGIVITPQSAGAVGETTYPGMAAASRIELKFWKGSDGSEEGSIGGEKTIVLEPYGSYKLQSNNQFANLAEDDEATGYFEKDANGSYKITLDSSATPIGAGEVWYVTVVIWIEGTDAECKNFSAGTGFDVDIEFVYTKENAAETLDEKWEKDDYQYDANAKELTVTFA